ncbi:hypothetical protein [Bradyrhizobium sp. th.b2]|uniref:hypothetical protein n=1 Tax=Bradyrhizobium sp. th-b2 TaxID=172088 RepID=UPI000412FADA|nr:hypothetical protein [Bradyrhizobium sp. th.b2]
MILTDTETKIAVYDLTRRIMGRPLFASPPMSFAPVAGNLTGIVAELDAIIASAAALRDRVAALSAPAPITMPVRAYRNAAEAFSERGLPFDKQKIRRLCRANAVDDPNGAQFAQMLLGTWHVVMPAFDAWCERIERGLERF